MQNHETIPVYDYRQHASTLGARALYENPDLATSLLLDMGEATAPQIDVESLFFTGMCHDDNSQLIDQGGRPNTQVLAKNDTYAISLGAFKDLSTDSRHRWNPFLHAYKWQKSYSAVGVYDPGQLELATDNGRPIYQHVDGLTVDRACLALCVLAIPPGKILHALE